MRRIVLCGILLCVYNSEPLNFVVLLADDAGYGRRDTSMRDWLHSRLLVVSGDLGAFGAPSTRTPHLDRLAYEGMKLTQWYAAAPVCTPSRAGIMVGIITCEHRSNL